ncbi:hypothetical protein MJO28_003918 [Puccinia striiformis f. sp. tritici]|uniref:Uncharacterized protein n=1 Tax=Puccinia striiformis f. sp. tritici TaxID=168172 RepID=A0ACC0EMD6_9BASI|nr:hypothetical protein MJO28_003918 [Puccinia striiformis f. sp. tritici]
MTEGSTRAFVSQDTSSLRIEDHLRHSFYRCLGMCRSVKLPTRSQTNTSHGSGNGLSGPFCGIDTNCEFKKPRSTPDFVQARVNSSRTCFLIE